MKSADQSTKKIAVAMSGGVDSSVTAALLKNQGHDVVGITMQVWPSDRFESDVSRFGGCCSLSAVHDAKRVAAKLDIPHYVLNFRSLFQKTVIEDFINEYHRGRTPNPCIRCNQYVKFDALLKRAAASGYPALATGHYARINLNKKTGRYELKRGLDIEKDQSYFLYVMNQQQLKSTIFPLGNYKKKDIRNLAEEFDLPVAKKPESQEICFIPGKSYADFIANEIPGAAIAGDILDKTGKVLGRHKGLIYYTCGQRKGLGISAEQPLYVTEINKEANTLIVGSEEDLYKSKLTADEVNLVSLEKIESGMEAEVQIRYNGKAAPAKVFNRDTDKIEIDFKQRQKAVSPGQACVIYKGETVLAGATIEKAGIV